MIGNLILAAALSSAVATPTIPATAEPGREYHVRVVARDGDAPPTTPSLRVRAGHPATFMVANDSYMIRLIATPAADDRVSLASEYSVWTREGLRYNHATVDLLANGETSTVAFPRTDPTTGEVRQMRFEVSVQPMD